MSFACRFIFFEDFSNKSVVNTVFTMARFKSAAKVVVVSLLLDGKLAFQAYDFFHPAAADVTKSNDMLSVTLRYVWSPTNPIEYDGQIFSTLKDFNGRHFTIGTNPWSHHVLGNLIPEEEGGTPVNKYRDYWGYEIDLLVETQKILNFTYTIVNPADGKWGHIEADGTWSGLVAQAAFGEVDFVICDMFIIYSRQQVTDGTIAFDKDFMAFVTPRPLPLPKFLALIQPFHYFVWFTIVASVIISSIVFVLVANGEEIILGIDCSSWSTLSEAGWYCFSTMIGESVTRDTKSENANALR
jgi:hypothetical protein